MSHSDQVSVRGLLSICHFGEPKVDPVDIKIMVSSEPPIDLISGELLETEEPVLELHFSEETSWRVYLSNDAGAFLAGLLASKSGVSFHGE